MFLIRGVSILGFQVLGSLGYLGMLAGSVVRRVYALGSHERVRRPLLLVSCVPKISFGLSFSIVGLS